MSIMLRSLLYCLLLAIYSFQGIFLECTEWDTAEMRQIPVSYKGRIRPLEAYARLWLEEFYGAEEIRSEHLQEFNLASHSALELLWQMHFLGHAPWDNAPLFKVSKMKVKKALNLSEETSYFSYNTLSKQIYKEKLTNLEFLKPLLAYYFWNSYQSPLNRSKNPKQELRSLAPGLWVILKDNQLIVVESSSQSPWNFLQPGMVLVENVHAFDLAKYKKYSEEALRLLSALNLYKQVGGNEIAEIEIAKTISVLQKNTFSPERISEELNIRFPVYDRLMQADRLLPVLPSKLRVAVWLPLKSLKLKIYNPQTKELELVSNFTSYPDLIFKDIQKTYIALEKAVVVKNAGNIANLSEKLIAYLGEGYQNLSGSLAIEAAGKVITYPTPFKLQVEVAYYRFPLTAIIFILYISAIVAFFFSFIWKKSIFTKTGIGFFLLAFLVHTGLLFVRSYILNRPPVSNMFETVIYVPWVTVLVSFLLYMKWRYTMLLMASSIVACILLFLLQATALHHELENVQPVLDSQYWLIIHVLLVVGSYGVFALAGVLGHIYLLMAMFKKKETAAMRFIGKCVLQSMYIGIFMLIPGTILGGIWAAESWGRFWDWDPKESWAFISICLYLIGIHLYRYGRISYFGLSMGAVGGFLAISFTWYGVNYILGTGLHSYGFGSGGELYYYLFLLGETIFISYAIYDHQIVRKLKI